MSPTKPDINSQISLNFIQSNNSSCWKRCTDESNIYNIESEHAFTKHSFTVNPVHWNSNRLSKHINHLKAHLYWTKLRMTELIPLIAKSKCDLRWITKNGMLITLCLVPLNFSPGLPKPTKSQGRDDIAVQKPRLVNLLNIFHLRKKKALIHFPINWKPKFSISS